MASKCITVFVKFSDRSQSFIFIFIFIKQWVLEYLAKEDLHFALFSAFKVWYS